MKSDADQLLPLTPGHFIRGAPLIVFPDNPGENLGLHNRWQKLKIIHQKLSRRWRDEYLSELHRRYKWKYPSRNLALDDIVIIKDDAC
ncbi:hypothetical protein KR059_003392, partial [Drosophila kikkawai]